MNDEVPEGYRWEWVAENDQWKLADLFRICRRRNCVARAVAAIRRKHSSSPWGFRWWFYCAAHMYGRKIEDGVVKSRRLVQIEEPSAERKRSDD